MHLYFLYDCVQLGEHAVGVELDYILIRFIIIFIIIISALAKRYI